VGCRRVPDRRAVHRVVLDSGVSRSGRRRADPGCGRRISRGISLRGHDVLRRVRRCGRRRGDRAPFVFRRSVALAWPSLRGPGRAERGRHASPRRGQLAAMKCPYCAHLGDKVVDSRESKEGDVIRRRRECLECGKRFTSYERIDEIPYMVVKKDGRRERFERQKLVAGLLKACEKRPVRVAALEAVADRVESALQEKSDREISTEEIGAYVMQELKT